MSSVAHGVKAKVSGISTDAALFSEHGVQLVHHYRVFGDCVAHASLRGSFVIDLLYFTNLACADWAAKRSQNSGPESRSSPDQPVPLPRNAKQRTSDDDPPVRRVPGRVRRVITGPHRGSRLRGQVLSPASAKDAFGFVQLAATDLACVIAVTALHHAECRAGYRQSSSVATQQHPSSPGSRSSTPCLDLAAFDSECSGSATMGSTMWTGIWWTHQSSVKLSHRACPRLRVGFRRLTLGSHLSECTTGCRRVTDVKPGSAASPSGVSGVPVVVNAVVAQPGAGGI